MVPHLCDRVQTPIQAPTVPHFLDHIQTPIPVNVPHLRLCRAWHTSTLGTSTLTLHSTSTPIIIVLLLVADQQYSTWTPRPHSYPTLVILASYIISHSLDPSRPHTITPCRSPGLILLCGVVLPLLLHLSPCGAAPTLAFSFFRQPRAFSVL